VIVNKYTIIQDSEKFITKKGFKYINILNRKHGPEIRDGDDHARSVPQSESQSPRSHIRPLCPARPRESSHS